MVCGGGGGRAGFSIIVVSRAAYNRRNESVGM